MAKLIPTKEQWKDWTLPSKAGYAGFVLAILGIIVAIGFGIYSIWPQKISEYTCNNNTPIDKCPLETDVYGYDMAHPEGSTVDGIVWNNHLVDVRVVFINNSRSKIQNISFVVNPETHIRKAVQATTVPNVNIFPQMGPIREMALTVVNKDGKESIITPDTSADYIAPAVAVQCPELLPNGEVKIVTACIALNPSKNGKPPKTLVAPRRPPKWVDLVGTYETIEAGKQSRYNYKHRFSLNFGGKLLKKTPANN